MDREEVASWIKSLEGAQDAKILSIACFSLAVYEYMITLDEEVTYFWSGKWTISRVLFLVNRYLPMCIMIEGQLSSDSSFPVPNLNCKPLIQTLFYFNIIAVTVIQGVLVIRIWYLFQNNNLIRLGIIVGFTASVAFSLLFTHISARSVKLIPYSSLSWIFPRLRNEGCLAERPPGFWRLYMPSLVLHTILYVLTAIRALRNRRLLKDAPVLKRLLRDGGFFYIVVFVSVMLTTIGSALTKAPTINIPAIYSPFLLTTTSIAISRVMMSIHSLAHKLGSDSAWLLNNVELQRVGWRVGAHEGELIVEHPVVYANDDDDLESETHSISKRSLRSLKETRVGVFDDRSW